jgi:thienamycin biosynthesis protein ThnO
MAGARAARPELDRSAAGHRAESDLPVVVPGLLGARAMLGSAPTTVTDLAGRAIAQVGVTGRLVQFQMAELAARTSPALRAIDDDAWFGMLGSAARSVADETAASSRPSPTPAGRRRETGRPDGAVADLVPATSVATGLPPARIRHGILTAAADLERMAEILAVQAPGGDVAAFRAAVVADRSWQWRPAGRSVFVRVPGNFPTIVVEWLQALALRRPVLLGTSVADPFTSYTFADALYRAGLPDGALSICHGDASTLLRLADQVLWPGGEPPAGMVHGQVKTYHTGRSKAVLTDRRCGQDVWSRLARMASNGCGRLCTNLSGLAVAGDAAAAAERLAAELALPVLPLDDERATVPAFPDRAQRDRLATAIEREIAAGAVDLMAEMTEVPLRIDLDGLAFLRPTVLLVDTESALWGMEMPFPFVTVAQVPRSRLRAACAGSLIVAVPGAEPDVVAQLADESTVDKVFAGRDFDRGYDPRDPHEGYVADFLFRRKAVVIGPPS